MIQKSWIRSSLLILLALFLLQWLLLFSLREPSWDAVSYYAYARSAIFDGDLHFANDYQLSYPTAGDQFVSKELDQKLTSTGLVENLFAIGAPLLWLPWLAVLRLAAPFLLSAEGSFSGYERFFVGNLAAFSAILGFLAILISYHVARLVTNRKLALAAAVTLMFTTPLIFYQFRDPLYSHAASAFTVALCVLVWIRQTERLGSSWQALGLGALIGLAGLVRWQNLTYLLLPLLSTLFIWLKNPAKKDVREWGRALFYLFLTGTAALCVFSLQLAVWRVLYGSFITIPQGDSFLSSGPIYLVPFLFSPFRGVLFWMPVFFLALTGLIALSKSNTRVGVPLLVMLLLALLINGSLRDWFAGAGFGPRRLTSEFVILLVGYAAFLRLLPHRVRTWAAVILGLALAFQQWVLLRFALPERIGGRVLSMLPTFGWQDDPLPQFVSEFSALALRALQRPLDFFVHPNSPLDLLLYEQIWPLQHLGVLLATATFVLVITGGLILLKKQWKPGVFAVLAFVLIVLVLGLADWWILTAA